MASAASVVSDDSGDCPDPGDLEPAAVVRRRPDSRIVVRRLRRRSGRVLVAVGVRVSPPWFAGSPLTAVVSAGWIAPARRSSSPCPGGASGKPNLSVSIVVSLPTNPRSSPEYSVISTRYFVKIGTDANGHPGARIQRTVSISWWAASCASRILVLIRPTSSPSRRTPPAPSWRSAARRRCFPRSLR